MSESKVSTKQTKGLAGEHNGAFSKQRVRHFPQEQQNKRKRIVNIGLTFKVNTIILQMNDNGFFASTGHAATLSR